jgi:hypothetical protein
MRIQPFAPRLLAALLVSATLLLVDRDARADRTGAPEASGSPVRLLAVAELGFLAPLDHRVQFGRDGTNFDYVDEGGQDRLFAVARLSIEAHLRRHQLIFLYQPLELETTAVARRDVRVDDVLFTEGTPLALRYGFPFYRLTYQYDLLPCPSRELAVGLALQLRNATIDFASLDGTQLASNGGVGVVPLLAARGRMDIGRGMWLGFDAVGFYAPVSYINGDDNDVVGAILDASVRFGVALPHGAEAFVNVRYLGGGAEGEDDSAVPPDDGYTRNWLHFLFVSLGASIGTPVG